MLRLRLLGIFLVLATNAFSTHAAVRSWVSAVNGQDSNDCSLATPCRTFARAIQTTNEGGEVVVLHSGGYGSVTITTSVSIISPPGIHAAIAPTTGAAITIDSSGALVVLRGLYLNSQGASAGVSIESAFIVHIENLVVHGFLSNGVELVTDVPTEVFVKDTIVRNCGGTGFSATPFDGSALVNLDRVRLQRNFHGLVADSGTRLTVRDTIATANLGYGFQIRNGGSLGRATAVFENSAASDCAIAGFAAFEGALLTARNCSSIRNPTGFWAFHPSAAATPATRLNADHCIASNNTNGFLAGFGAGAGAAILAVTSSTASNNVSNGIVASDHGTVKAFGNLATGNAFGLNGQTGTFESAGQNVSSGNLTNDVLGTLVTIPTY